VGIIAASGYLYLDHKSSARIGSPAAGDVRARPVAPQSISASTPAISEKVAKPSPAYANGRTAQVANTQASSANLSGVCKACADVGTGHISGGCCARRFGNEIAPPKWKSYSRSGRGRRGPWLALSALLSRRRSSIGFDDRKLRLRPGPGDSFFNEVGDSCQHCESLVSRRRPRRTPIGPAEVWWNLPTVARFRRPERWPINNTQMIRSVFLREDSRYLNENRKPALVAISGMVVSEVI